MLWSWGKDTRANTTLLLISMVIACVIEQKPAKSSHTVPPVPQSSGGLLAPAEATSMGSVSMKHGAALTQDINNKRRVNKTAFTGLEHRVPTSITMRCTMLHNYTETFES